MNYILKNWRVVLASTILICVAIALVVNKETKTSQTSATKSETVTLTISGEVVKPGSYTVKKNSSIWDNAYMYGGFTEFADLKKTDIYAPITKDLSVTIKSKTKVNTDYIDQLYQIPIE